MKQRLPLPPPPARRAAVACVFFLLALAGCRRGEPAASTSNANAANGGAAGAQQQPPPAPTQCGVPYYPVRAGLEKQYRVNYGRGGVAPATYTESYADIKPDSFTLRYSFPELTVDTGWNCAPEGMVALEYGKLDFSRQPAGFKMETISRSGVTVPEAARWRVGESWDTRYEIKTEMSAPGGRGQGTGTGTIEITNRVVARESVAVPGGTFDALKVESTLAMKMTVRVGQMTVPTNTSLRNVSWFAENVGMVKSLSSGDFGDATTELVGLKQ